MAPITLPKGVNLDGAFLDDAPDLQGEAEGKDAGHQHKGGERTEEKGDEWWHGGKRWEMGLRQE
jgi:hypothetical protein